MQKHVSDIHGERAAPPPPPSPALSLPARAAILGPIAANVAFVMELTLVPLLLPAIQQHFGLSVGDLTWIFNSYAIAVATGVFIGGFSRRCFPCCSHGPHRKNPGAC